MLGDLIKLYFYRGYRYKLNLCILSGVHGFRISLRTLKRHLKDLGLRKKGASCCDADIKSCTEVLRQIQ